MKARDLLPYSQARTFNACSWSCITASGCARPLLWEKLLASGQIPNTLSPVLHCWLSTFAHTPPYLEGILMSLHAMVTGDPLKTISLLAEVPTLSSCQNAWTEPALLFWYKVGIHTTAIKDCHKRFGQQKLFVYRRWLVMTRARMFM
jgi:hypothetical protein